MSTDIIQNELTSCLTEIEKVEKELDAQLQILGKEVDAGFSQMRELNNAVTELATKVVRNPKWAGGLMLAGAALSSVIGAYEGVKAAKAHNEALAKLLVTKRKIAKEKIESIKRLRGIVDHVLDRLKKLVDNEAAGSYDINQIDENIWNIKLSNMDKTMAIYRASLYSKLLVEYLYGEYKAWMNGQQRSRMERPTYLDCNVIIKKDLASRSDSIREVNHLFKNEDTVIQGNDVYTVNDPHIFSTLLLDYGFNDNEQKKIKSLPKPNTSYLGTKISECESYKTYKHYLKQQNIADFFSGGMIVFILMIVFIFLDYLLFHWLDWAAWLEWTLGIILGIVGCGAIIAFEAITETFEEMHESNLKDIFSEAMNTQLKAAGYVEIYQPDLDKKNVTWEGVKGLAGGFLSAFFE